MAPHPFRTRPHRTLLGLALPVLGSLVAEPVTGLVDTAFVARLGAGPLAALGVGAIVLSGARIGAGSVIGAGAVVREGEIVPPGSLMVGVPARLARTLDDTARQTNLDWAEKYIRLAELHKNHSGGGAPLQQQ